MTDAISITIAILALAISAITAWLTLFRRGTVKMTQPTVIFFDQTGRALRMSQLFPKYFCVLYFLRRQNAVESWKACTLRFHGMRQSKTSIFGSTVTKGWFVEADYSLAKQESLLTIISWSPMTEALFASLKDATELMSLPDYWETGTERCYFHRLSMSQARSLLNLQGRIVACILTGDQTRRAIFRMSINDRLFRTKTFLSC